MVNCVVFRAALRYGRLCYEKSQCPLRLLLLLAHPGAPPEINVECPPKSTAQVRPVHMALRQVACHSLSRRSCRMQITAKPSLRCIAVQSASHGLSWPRCTPNLKPQ